MATDPLQQEIRSKIESDRLPSTVARRFFAGLGTGRQCACCDQSISEPDIEYELEIPEQGSWPMHIHCYKAWLLVVMAVAQSPQIPPLLRFDTSGHDQASK
jgi:hypothetical protein